MRDKKIKEKKTKKAARIVKPVLICCGVMLLILIGVLAAFVWKQIQQAPDISEIDATPDGYLSTILDKDENVMNTLYVTESNRIYVGLENIPQELQEAFIAIEDARFYSHKGIDIKGILRAVGQGIAKGSFSQGASTITQQLLKNNVFTDWMEEETFYDRVCRKVQEQYLAICLEQNYSKEWILENYLNTINLGGGTRGVQVAAQYYFSKDVSELSLAECALLAGITKNPTAYNPINHPDKSLDRQHLVLKAMLEEGYISQEEYDMAYAEDVIAALITDSEERGTKIFSWFEDSLLEQLIEDLMVEYNYNEEEAWDMIYSGGLTIYSTQDTRLQEICETEATRSEWYTDEQEISVVVTDVSTGAVAAIIGGSEEKTASLTYNRATDAIRQPGSTIKIIGEYAAAIDTGVVSLGTAINDEPYTYLDGTPLSNSTGTYKGMTTVREAIASSGNIVALKTFQMVGESKVYEYLQKFGITTLTQEDRNEALSIGGTYNGVTNLEMTAAYNAIANSGRYTEPYYYTKVVDRRGNIILQHQTDYEQIIGEDTAELLTDAMEDVIAYGTGTEAAVSGLTLAGKSGTTNENRDVWFVGFSSYYTCGIWGGYDNNSAQTSGSYVKQIWKSVMNQAHLEKENMPITDTSKLTSVTICTKCGNLAIDGTCDDTVQGDMTREEYYMTGTEPKKMCDCHIRVTICQESEMEAGDYCPEEMLLEKVYLKTGTEGTEDSAYVLPESMKNTCDIHTHFWDQWKDGEMEEEAEGKENESDTENNGSSENEAGTENGWWNGFFGDMFW